jgi:hypothetical protein
MSSVARDRYDVCPQLETYDTLLPTLSPYLTVASPRNHRSAVVNTDQTGFRMSYAGPQQIDTTTWPPDGRRAALVLGSSFVFGVGATSDHETLVSHLNAILPYAFLNLGVRAGNSTQELVAAIPFVERADCIIVCSGINNLLVNLQSLGLNELFGPFFGEGTYEPLRNRPLAEISSVVAGGTSGLGLKRLARESLERMRPRRKTPRRVTTGAGTDLAAHVDRAIRLQGRDLRLLARARRPGSTLLFAAQPFAPCCPRTPLPEERLLFDITDRAEGAEWEVTRDALIKLWPGYVAALRQICMDEGLPFLDLNACELSGWAFVDRVHMTDAGYRQAAGYLADGVVRCAS